MSQSRNLIALDVGEKRIGVASCNMSVRIAIPLLTLQVDGTEIEEIAQIALNEKVETIVVGYPRNQSGEPTAQTAYVQNFAEKLKDIAHVEFQDESLTSVAAEQRLASHKRPYSKEDIDAQAAAIILQDYLEIHHEA